MNRREALKGLSLSIGYVVSTPLVLNVLESCTQPKIGWSAVFFDSGEQTLVTHLVDIILPASNIPGGLDLNLPEFADMMCRDVLNETDQAYFHKGSMLFAEQVNQHSGRAVERAKKSDITEVFKKFFDLSENDSKLVLKTQSMQFQSLKEEDEKNDFLIYKFLFTIRSFALLGYFTSEKIGTEVLNFDPIPGVWQPCISVNEVGNAWTI